VLLAVFTDIHANRQAFSACLDFARARGAGRMIFLGDYVGYGADPEWTVEVVMGLVDAGAIAVRGNHDNAIGTTTETMNAEAQAAIEWTRGRLSAAQRRFLAELPLTLQEEDRLYVHSEASNPARWRYVRNTLDAARSIVATEAHATFCGHIHQPALYSMSSAAKMTSFVPTSGVPVRLLGGGAGWPFSARWGSPAIAIRRPRLRCSIPGRAKSPIAGCPTTLRQRRSGFAKMACRSGWPIGYWSGGKRWPGLRFSPAQS
jgi:predicted phosphodiesterase